MTLQQRAVLCLAERSARGEIDGVRHGERRIDGIDAAHEIGVLGRGGEGRDLLAAKRKEHPPRHVSQRGDRVLDRRHLAPLIALPLYPGPTPQREQRHARLFGRAGGIGGDGRGIRVRGINQRVDAIIAQEPRKPVGAAEAAGPDGYGLRQGLGRTSGKGQCHGDAGASGECAGKASGFRRATENEDAHGAG
jgi:hypothetical protein